MQIDRFAFVIGKKREKSQGEQKCGTECGNIWLDTEWSENVVPYGRCGKGTELVWVIGI